VKPLEKLQHHGPILPLPVAIWSRVPVKQIPGRRDGDPGPRLVQGSSPYPGTQNVTVLKDGTRLANPGCMIPTTG